MDLWGRCGLCERWFYCERWSDPVATAPTCPVCREPAEAIVDRHTDRRLTSWAERMLPGGWEPDDRPRLDPTAG